MEQQDLETRFVKLMTILAAACNTELSEADFTLYDTMLSRSGYPNVIKAIEHLIMRRRPGERFPSVMEIQGIINPEVDPVTQAIDITNQMITFMKSTGPDGKWHKRVSYKTPQEAVTRAIGELAWAAFERRGGYRGLYGEWAELRNSQLTFFRSQLKESIVAIIHKAKAGNLDTPTALPEPTIKREQSSGMSSMKELADQVTQQIMDKRRS